MYLTAPFLSSFLRLASFGIIASFFLIAQAKALNLTAIHVGFGDAVCPVRAETTSLNTQVSQKCVERDMASGSLSAVTSGASSNFSWDFSYALYGSGTNEELDISLQYSLYVAISSGLSMASASSVGGGVKFSIDDGSAIASVTADSPSNGCILRPLLGDDVQLGNGEFFALGPREYLLKSDDSLVVGGGTPESGRSGGNCNVHLQRFGARHIASAKVEDLSQEILDPDYGFSEGRSQKTKELIPYKKGPYSFGDGDNIFQRYFTTVLSYPRVTPLVGLQLIADPVTPSGDPDPNLPSFFVTGVGVDPDCLSSTTRQLDSYNDISSVTAPLSRAKGNLPLSDVFTCARSTGPGDETQPKFNKFKFRIIGALKSVWWVTQDNEEFEFAPAAIEQALWHMPSGILRFGPEDVGGDDWVSKTTYEWLDGKQNSGLVINDASGEHGRYLGHIGHVFGNDIDIFHFAALVPTDFHIGRRTAGLGSANYKEIEKAAQYCYNKNVIDPLAALISCQDVVDWVVIHRERLAYWGKDPRIRKILVGWGADYTGTAPRNGYKLVFGWLWHVLITGQLIGTSPSVLMDLKLGKWDPVGGKVQPFAGHNDHIHISLKGEGEK